VYAVAFWRISIEKEENGQNSPITKEKMTPIIKVATRKQTRKVPVGPVAIGGDAPISVQSMTISNTFEIDQCVAEINKLADAGCELVRVTVPRKQDTDALPEIMRQSPVPIIADVHFQFRRALDAVEAGVPKIRLNPGNIQDRKQVEKVIAACKANGAAIRVGVNEGSIVERKDLEVRAGEQEQNLLNLMMEKLAEYIGIFEDNNFDNLVLAAKCTDAARCIVINRMISEKYDYPLHLGVTHSGTVETGSIRSSVALGTLLAEGIGDTLRISLAGDPVEEARVAWEVLNSLYLRPRTSPELIACPTCGRVEVDLFKMVDEVKGALEGINHPVKIAVMGCIVNGPGEAEGSDVGISAGKSKVQIYRHGQVVETVATDQGVAALLKHVKQHIEETKDKTDAEELANV
jgi:(E)-4-hydroxy-3-methylbut-2-enyl-diphosphate synthase